MARSENILLSHKFCAPKFKLFLDTLHGERKNDPERNKFCSPMGFARLIWMDRRVTRIHRAQIFCPPISFALPLNLFDLNKQFFSKLIFFLKHFKKTEERKNLLFKTFYPKNMLFSKQKYIYFLSKKKNLLFSLRNMDRNLYALYK